MTKEQFIKTMGNLDDDIIEDYLGTPVDEGRAVKLRTNSNKSRSFLKFAGIAAAIVCAAAIAIFAITKFRVPISPNGGDQSRYIAEIFTGGGASNEDNTVDVGGSDIKTITIGNSSYNVTYLNSFREPAFDKIYDRFETAGNTGGDLRGSITLDHETGEVVQFSNITPYPSIEDHETLSDDELKAAAEALMTDVDFSKYNVFEVQHYHTGMEDVLLKDHILEWEVKREISCAISVDVKISEDGSITHFDKTDNCPNDLTKPFVSNEERDKLLEKPIREYFKKNYDYDPEEVKFTIMSETLSAFHNKRCIVYYIEADYMGFPEVIGARITDTGAVIRQEGNNSSDTDKSGENSSEPKIEKTPVEFTSWDKKFQELLRPIVKGCNDLNIWFTNDAALDTTGFPIYEYVHFRFPEISGASGEPIERVYYQIPSGYSDIEGTSPIPDTAEGVIDSMLEHLTEDYAKSSNFYGCAKGTMTADPNGSYDVILDDKDYKFPPKLLEIDGAMYRAEGLSGQRPFSDINIDTVKFLSRKGDTIEFKYLSPLTYPEIDENGNAIMYPELEDEDRYYKTASTGVLVYERGGWRLDRDKIPPEKFSIDPYLDSVYYSQTDKEFFDSLGIPEITEAYKKGGAIDGLMDTDVFKPSPSADENGTKPDDVPEYHYPWGYTYDSFYDTVLSVYTKEAADKWLAAHCAFWNYYGELYCSKGMLDNNIWTGKETIEGNLKEVRREYQLISKSDTVVEFRRIVFRDIKNKFNGEYLPEHRNEYLNLQTDFKFVKTENGWREANDLTLWPADL